MLCLVQFEPTQCHQEVLEFNVIFRVCDDGNNNRWAKTLNAKIITHVLPLGSKPTISSPNDITDLTFIAMSFVLQFNVILLKAVMTFASVVDMEDLA